MQKNELMELLLDSMKDPVVFADNDHIIRYMNSAAIKRFKDGETLVGRSIFSCHSERSADIIKSIHSDMKKDLEEKLITDNEKQRVYMRAVRDRDGNLIGYYERYEPPVSAK